MWTKIHLTDSDIVKFEGNYWYFILDGEQYKLNELSYPNIKNVIDKLEAYLKRNGAWPCNTVSYDELKNILTDHLESCYHFELSKILIRINKYDFRYRRDDKFWTYYKVLGGNYPKKIDSLSVEELASIKNCFDKDDVTITYSTTVFTTSSSFEFSTKLATDNLMKAIDALLYDKMKDQIQPVVLTAVDSNHNHSDIISNDSAVNNIHNETKYMYYNIILGSNITVCHDSKEWKVTIDNTELPLKLLSYLQIKLTIEALEAFIKKYGALQNSDIDLNVLLKQLYERHNQNLLFNTSFNLLNFSIRYMPKMKDWGYENEANELISLSVLHNRILEQIRNTMTIVDDFPTQNLYDSISAILNDKNRTAQGTDSVTETVSVKQDKPNESFHIHGVDYRYNVDSELWVWGMFEGPISGPKPLKDLHEITLTQARKFLLSYTDLKICSENFAFSVKHLLSNIEEALKVKYSQPVNVANETHDVYTVNLSNSVLFLARNKQSHLVPFIEKWAYYERVQYHERAQTDETALWKTISSASKKDLRRLSDAVLQEELIHLETNNIIDKNFLIDLLKHIAKVISEKKLAKKLG
jgi:hypothetical protein